MLRIWEEAGEGCVSWQRQVAFFLECKSPLLPIITSSQGPLGGQRREQAAWWPWLRGLQGMAQRVSAEGTGLNTRRDFQISFKSLRFSERKK